MNAFKFFIKQLLILTSVLYLISAYYTQPRRVHIFIDYATSPTVLQMTEFIRLPEKDVKIIGWNRFKNRSHIIKKHKIQKNVIEVSSILKKSSKEKIETFSHILQGIEASNAQTIYEIHLNYKHIGWLGIQLFKLIPPHKIKQVHIYEDGSGTLYKDVNNKNIHKHALNFATQFQTELKKTTPSLYHPNVYLITIPMFYPTTYHTTIVNKAKLIQKQAIYKHFKKLTFMPVDFRKLKTELTSQEKTKLYQLLDIDFSHITKYIQKDKPFGLFLWDGMNLPVRYQAEKKLLDKMEEHSQKYGTIWFSKNHPTAHSPYLPRPFLKPLPAHFPMEVLMISDYPFQYVAGAGSSAFYSLKPEEIIGYIPNRYWSYVKSLINLKILDNEKVYYW